MFATALFPFIERANPRAFDLSRQGMARTGAELLRWFACIVSGKSKPSPAPIHESLGRAFGASGELCDLIRCMLVLSADHGYRSSHLCCSSLRHGWRDAPIARY